MIMSFNVCSAPASPEASIITDAEAKGGRRSPRFDRQVRRRHQGLHRRKRQGAIDRASKTGSEGRGWIEVTSKLLPRPARRHHRSNAARGRHPRRDTRARALDSEEGGSKTRRSRKPPRPRRHRPGSNGARPIELAAIHFSRRPFTLPEKAEGRTFNGPTTSGQLNCTGGNSLLISQCNLMTISQVCIKRPVFTWVPGRHPRCSRELFSYGELRSICSPTSAFPVCTVRSSDVERRLHDKMRYYQHRLGHRRSTTAGRRSGSCSQRRVGNAGSARQGQLADSDGADPSTGPTPARYSHDDRSLRPATFAGQPASQIQSARNG